MRFQRRRWAVRPGRLPDLPSAARRHGLHGSWRHAWSGIHRFADFAAAIQPATHHPGLHRFFQGATWLWAAIFLLLTAGLTVMLGHRAGQMFLMPSTAATVALVVAGTGASTLWFLSVLRRLGLRLRFAPA
jgi:hypothetical protein